MPSETYVSKNRTDCAMRRSYYPYVPGPVIPPGMELLQITNDPHDAASALVGDCLLSDARLALEALSKLLGSPDSRSHDDGTHESVIAKALADSSSKSQSSVMTAMDAFSAVADHRPQNAILVNETPSNAADLLHAWPAVEPESYFIFASGGLGWGAPAAVGIALAQKHHGTSRPTVLAIGDGSLHYSVQSIYTAVQQQVKLVYLVPDNGEYAILKEFAVLEKTPNVPALDLPGLNAVAVAKAYGCRAFRANNTQELQEYFQQALKADGPTLIEFPIDKQLRPLVAQAAPVS